jgi:methoxymalonate biosynthesis acyl carrier protein
MTEVAHMATRVTQIVRDVLQAEVDSADVDLLEGGVLDSLMFVELLHDLQVEFSVEIPLDELEIDNFRTIHRIARYIEDLRSEPARDATLVT